MIVITSHRFNTSESNPLLFSIPFPFQTSASQAQLLRDSGGWKELMALFLFVMTGLWPVRHLLNRTSEYQLLLRSPARAVARVRRAHLSCFFRPFHTFRGRAASKKSISSSSRLQEVRNRASVSFFFFSWNDWRWFGIEKWGCLVCMNVSKSESAAPRFVLLKALQLIPLLSQGWLQVQIGAIVGELQRAVVKLWKWKEWNKRLNESSKQKVTPRQN